MTDASNCGSINMIPGISYFTATASCVLTIGTTMLHAMILYAIIKDRENKFQLFFYKLLLNISIADILSGLFNDPYSAVFHTQEALHETPINIRVFHVSLYLLGSVPLVTMVILCLDRVLALMYPMKYRKGLQGWKSWAVLVVIWILSILQIMAYFAMGFIPYLVVFAAVNIATTTIAMIATFIVYHKNLGRNVNPGQSEEKVNEIQSRKCQKRQQREKRATRTFLIMSVVIILSYLPTCFATGYMNSCKNCNCALVHSLRDIAIVSILAGPLFRAINFLTCLKSLQVVCNRVGKRPSESLQMSSDQQQEVGRIEQKRKNTSV